MIKKKPPIIKSIRVKLIDYDFINNQLKTNILINILLHKKKKHILIIGKIEKILFKLISDLLKPIVKGKTLQKR